jgi:hypothetical protein
MMTGIMVILLTTDVTRGFAMRMSRENNVIEFVSAGLMLAGGVYGLLLAMKAKARREAWWVWGFFLLFSLGMLLVGMEELAWGQKLIGYATPVAIAKINQQGEMTLHNLPRIHGHSEMLWVVFGTGGLVGVVLLGRRAFEKIATPVVLIPWFVMIMAVTLPSVWIEFGSIERRVDLLVNRMDEFNEMLIAMVSCLYIWLCARRLARAWGGNEDVPSPEGMGLGGG